MTMRAEAMLTSMPLTDVPSPQWTAETAQRVSGSGSHSTCTPVRRSREFMSLNSFFSRVYVVQCESTRTYKTYIIPLGVVIGVFLVCSHREGMMREPYPYVVSLGIAISPHI